MPMLIQNLGLIGRLYIDNQDCLPGRSPLPSLRRIAYVDQNHETICADCANRIIRAREGFHVALSLAGYGESMSFREYDYSVIPAILNDAPWEASQEPPECYVFIGVGERIICKECGKHIQCGMYL